MKLGLLKRLLSHVREGDVPAHRVGLGPCWVWTAHRDAQGYGRLRDGARLLRAHRALFVLLSPNGSTLGDGDVLDHRCRNRGCVNPEHLEPLSSRHNTLRGVHDRRAAGVLPLFPLDEVG